MTTEGLCDNEDWTTTVINYIVIIFHSWWYSV